MAVTVELEPGFNAGNINVFINDFDLNQYTFIANGGRGDTAAKVVKAETVAMAVGGAGATV